jgi:hypothetical protein
MLAMWESAFTPPLVSYRTIPLRPPRQRPLPPGEQDDSEDDTFFGRQIRFVASFRRAQAVVNTPTNAPAPFLAPPPAQAPTGLAAPRGPAAAASSAAAPEKAPPPRQPAAAAAAPRASTPPQHTRAAPKKAPPPLRPPATLTPVGDIRLQGQEGATLTTLRYIHMEGRIVRVDDAGRPLPSPLVDPARSSGTVPAPAQASPIGARIQVPRAASSPLSRPRAPPLPRHRAKTPHPAFPDDAPVVKPRPLSRPRPLFHSTDVHAAPVQQPPAD